MKTHHLTCSCCNPIWKEFLPEGFELTAPKAPAKNETTESNTVTMFHHPHKKAIITMEGRAPKAVEALVIQGDKIMYAGSFAKAREQALDLVKPNGELVQRLLEEGETIVPGLIDPHMHTLPTALFNLFHDAGPFEGQNLRRNYNVNTVLDVLKAQGDTDLPWVLARDVDPSLFTGPDSKALNKDVLDKTGIEKPIFAMNASMHLAYINKAAIKRLTEKGYTLPSDGVLQEAAETIPALKIIVADCAHDPSEFMGLMQEKVDEILKTASARGITTMLDAGVDPSNVGKGGMADQPKYLSDLAHNEDCPVRLGAALAVESVESFEKQVVPHYQPGHGDDKFFIPFVKVVSDGSNQGMTGYQYKSYCCDADYVAYTDENSYANENHGLFNFENMFSFETLVQRVHAAGWPLMIHANGDQAISRTIEAYKKVSPLGETLEKGRNRIEHCSIASDEHLQDMREYGISPSFLIGHVGYWGYSFKTETLGEERANQLDRCNSALKYGMRYTVHSDHSVSPLGVLRMMEQSISRYMEGAPKDADDKILNPDECVTRVEALRAATIDAAWQCHMDDKIGSLEKGKLADFVLLAQSPLTYTSDNPENPVEGMRDIKVLETWKGGKRFKY